MNKVLMAFALMVVAMSGQAREVVLERMTDDMVKPCHKPLPLTRLTRAVVPVMPGRGVNLIFPQELELERSNVTVTLSSEDLFTTEDLIEQSSILPIGFKRVDYDADDGKVRDLTITTEHFIISLGLIVDMAPDRHCTNIEFSLLPDQLKQIEEENKRRYKAALDAKYKQRMEELDQEVRESALLMVADLSDINPEHWRIKEEQTIEMPNGDEVILYVRDIKQFGEFFVLSYEVENDSPTESLYITKSEVLQEKTPLAGAMRLTKKLKPKEIVQGTFASKKVIPNSLASLVLETSAGKIEVKW